MQQRRRFCFIASNRDRHVTFLGEFDRVSGEVHQQLPDANDVADETLRKGFLKVVSQFHFSRRGLWSEQLKRVFDATPQPLEVVINEAVELARRFGTADSPGFVNGVLDRVAKTKNESTTPDVPAPESPTESPLA